MAEKIVLELGDKEVIKNFETEKSLKKFSNTTQLKKDLKNEILSTLTMM